MTVQELFESEESWVAGTLYDVKIEELMIKFAQYHVEQALKAVKKNAEIKVSIKGNYKGAKYRELEDGEDYNPFETTQQYSIRKESILNAYPLTNIK